MTHRIRKGRSPFSADRNHLHHLLLDAGFTINGVIVLIVAESLVIGLIAALALLQHIPQPLFVISFLALMAGHFAVTANRPRAVAIFASFARLPHELGVRRSPPTWTPAATEAKIPSGKIHTAE